MVRQHPCGLVGDCPWPLVALGLVSVVQLWAIVFGDGSFAVSQAGEDGSFYVQIAHNMAQGKGVTFDGVADTTGVHWLWLGLLAGIFKVVPTSDPVTTFRVAAVAYFGLLVAAGAVTAKTSPIGGLFLVCYLANRGHWYMETHLVLLTLACAIRWPSWLSGMLLVWSRTDLVLLGLFTGRFRLVAGAAAGFVGVCLVNVMVDGSPISISAQIKSAGWNDWDTIWRAKHLILYYPVLPVMWLLAWGSPDRWFLAANALIAFHILRNSATEGWYLAPLFLTSLLCAGRVLDRHLPRLWHQWRLVGLSGVRR